MAEPSSRERSGRTGARFKTFISILVAAAAVGGAFLTWRISVASGRAAGADARGLEAALASANVSIALSTELSNNLAFFTSYRQHLRAAELLDKQAAAEPARRGFLSQEAFRERNLAATARGSVDADYLEIDPADGSESFDGNRFWEAQLASERALRPLDEKPFFAAADAIRNKSRELVLVTVSLAAALFLLVASTATSQWVRYYLAASGTLVFVLSFAAAILVEVAR